MVVSLSLRRTADTPTQCSIASPESSGSETSVAAGLSDLRDPRLRLRLRIMVVAYEWQVPAGAQPADDDQGDAEGRDSTRIQNSIMRPEWQAGDPVSRWPCPVVWSRTLIVFPRRRSAHRGNRTRRRDSNAEAVARMSTWSTSWPSAWTRSKRRHHAEGALHERDQGIGRLNRAAPCPHVARNSCARSSRRVSPVGDFRTPRQKWPVH